jgi:transglutaminase-like putative cysteine protease
MFPHLAKSVLLLLFSALLPPIALPASPGPATETHFLKDEAYRQRVHAQFEQRKVFARHRASALFDILDSPLSTQQREALEFLFAGMPLSDLADYDGTFFLRQVNAALEARDFFPWGKTIPDDIFRHFVLVHRVNNEALDDARSVFFAELKDRVKNLSMHDAALEVNHWCHEKVTYRGTDPRTSSPLALVRTSWGRCGEETTFTVTALRAVGIPARQCYVPRWAHTDSNHAWVEVWIDGQWHYLGACEPEPELDIGWFAAPATRAMMVHTNALGLYEGPEEKNRQTPSYTTLNLLASYAPVRRLNVRVLDTAGHAVSGARVQFKVHNSAELFPIHTADTDASGSTALLTGKGDLLLWAAKDGAFGYAKATATDAEVTVHLDKTPETLAAHSETFSLAPPPPGAVHSPNVTPEKAATNAARLKQENAIRATYTRTFITEAQAHALAENLHLDKAQTWHYLQTAQGNWQEIRDFLTRENKNPYLFPFLATLAEKDLRDTPAAYLSDHLNKTYSPLIRESVIRRLFVPYVFSPRIDLEQIRPWGSFLNQKFSLPKMPDDVIRHIRQNITLDDGANYSSSPISPQGVHELRVADKKSRDIYFVALCRSLGEPARLDPVTSAPQFLGFGKWENAVFDSENRIAATPARARLILQNDAANTVQPAYYTNYTLARFQGGDFDTLELWLGPQKEELPRQLELDAGHYRLLTATRANDGTAFLKAEYFEIKGGLSQIRTVTLPKVKEQKNVHGTIDMARAVTPANGTGTTLKTLANGKGLMVCIVDLSREPSRHILQEFPPVSAAFESWGGGVLLLTPDDKSDKNLDIASTLKGLPRQTVWAEDSGRTLLKAVTTALKLDFQEAFPLTLYLNESGEILYFSTGYTIGAGERVLKEIRP